MVEKTLWLEQRLQVTLEPSFGSPGGKVRHFLWQNLWQLILNLLCDPCISEDDAKSGSIYGGFIALVVGGGVDVDCYGGGVKDNNDCRMMVEY
ncbi:hypothetical protein Tco_1375406 [Tanacetum coccineum]